jgi:hypothetical protein
VVVYAHAHDAVMTDTGHLQAASVLCVFACNQ